MELIPITENTLSPVSIKVNGEWLETAVPRLFSQKYGGSKWCYFLTTSVSGRETSAVDIKSADLPKDGSRYYGRRRPSRTLNVSFYIESDSKEHAILAYEFVAGLLNRNEEVTLVFGDDRDRYYKGICSGITYNGRGYNGSATGIVGSVSFFCKDPHKYSNVIKTFDASYDSANKVLSVEIQNDGTIPVPINYDVMFNRNSGYIGFVSSEGALQFGDSEQTATSSSRELISYTGEQLVNAINDTSNPKVFDLSTYGDSTNENWYFSDHFHTRTGVFSVDPTPDKYITIDKKCLNSVVASTLAFGAGAVIDIRQNDVPVKNYRVDFQPWFETFKDQAQTGIMQILVVNKPTASDRAVVMSGFQFNKFETSNNNASIYFKVGYKKNGVPTIEDHNTTWSYQPNYESKFVANGPSGWFSKDGSTFKFVLDKLEKTISLSQYGPGGIHENLEATHLVIFIGNTKGHSKWVGRYVISGDQNSEYPRMRFNNIKMIQTDSVSETFSVDNTYRSGDKMLVDGNSATMTVNGAPRVSDEKIGSDYFMANPGLNEIQVLVSDFNVESTDSPINVTAKIREGWL